MVGVARRRRRADVAAVAVGASPREPTATVTLPAGTRPDGDRRGNFVSGARRRGTGRAASFHHWSSPRRGEGGRASLPWAERANVFEIDFDSRRRDVARRALLGGL